MELSYANSRRIKIIGYAFSFYLCHIAAVAIPRRIVTEIENKAVYVAEGLTRNLVRFIAKNNNEYSTEDLLSNLVAEHCKSKGGCLDQRLIDKN